MFLPAWVVLAPLVGASPPAELPPLKLDSHQVFLFVEGALKNPKVDRDKAEKLLQRIMDGKIRPLPEAPPKSEGESCTPVGKCGMYKCFYTNYDTGQIWCSPCCEH